jgi:uncharacterized membrane protein
MNVILENFKQNRQVWAWAVIVSLFLILVGHAPVLPIVSGGLLAVVITSLRALSYGQKKPWQVQK